MAVWLCGGFYCNAYVSIRMSRGENGVVESYSNIKLLPHERKIRRAQTVGVGLGNSRMSKKAMLLKWCQVITQDYEVSF